MELSMTADWRNEVSEFARRRILLLGFEELEASALSKMLMHELRVSSPVTLLGFADEVEMAGTELVIIQLGPKIPLRRWLSLAIQHSAKSIVCGAPKDVHARQAELRRASEILVLPGSPHEWPLRVNRLLGPLAANQEAAPKDAPVYPKCLVVDDDQSVRALLGAICGNLRIHLQTAADGVRALAIAREWQPDLIVLDIHLPLLSGIDVLRRLRQDETTCDTPVLCLTGCDDRETMAQAAALGATCYVVKPFSPPEVSRRIKGLAKVRTR
jgi:CheY-like chemotaxis protein